MTPNSNHTRTRHRTLPSNVIVHDVQEVDHDHAHEADHQGDQDQEVDRDVVHQGIDLALLKEVLHDHRNAVEAEVSLVAEVVVAPEVLEMLYLGCIGLTTPLF